MFKPEIYGTILKEKNLRTQIEIKEISVDIQLLYCCSVPDIKFLGPWIACDVCDQWYL